MLLTPQNDSCQVVPFGGSDLEFVHGLDELSLVDPRMVG
jgi:hypothetical protein